MIISDEASHVVVRKFLFHQVTRGVLGGYHLAEEFEISHLAPRQQEVKESFTVTDLSPESRFANQPD